MAEVTDLFTPTEDLRIKFPTGAVLQVTYNREVVTSNIIDPNSTDTNAIAVALCKVISAWDLTQQGEPVLLDPAVVGALPLAFAQYVFKAIIKDQNIDPN